MTFGDRDKEIIFYDIDYKNSFSHCVYFLAK